ncbi:MAG: 50S ribosomal protein L17 [Bacteroidales bacterium]|nr:MAG: 50S ribosomal protein L17 [Bacteroidales bacterium]
MRHRKGFNHLSRKSAHRKAMFANMASSLIIHKRIKTTTAKAKALRSYVEPLITRSKDDSTHSRRMAFRYLKDKEAVSELFREVSPKVGDRPGGYTRILKTGSRMGDNADMCILELVDYNENMLQQKEETRAKLTRRRRGGKKKPAEAVAESVETEAAAETGKDETDEATVKPVEQTRETDDSGAPEEIGDKDAGVSDEQDMETKKGEETVAEEKVEDPPEPKDDVKDTDTESVKDQTVTDKKQTKELTGQVLPEKEEEKKEKESGDKKE